MPQINGILLKHFYAQPTLHFLGLGGLLFILFAWLKPGNTELPPDQVIIDKDAVLQYVQYRNKAFNQEAAEQYLSRLSDDNFERMLNGMVREQVLYLEAKKLDLDIDDFVIKQRMIQKMEFLAGGFGSTSGPIKKEDVQRYFESNQSRYHEPASLTFTHVFIDKNKPNPQPRARQLLAQLNTDHIVFSDALKFGDRFLYHNNYVERDQDFISSQFGNDFARQLMNASPDEDRWTGPFTSQHGLHLVLLTRKKVGGVPHLEKIYNQVYLDANNTKLKQQTEQTIQTIVDAYSVKITVPNKDTFFNTHSSP